MSRVRVSCGRIEGKVFSWQGDQGFIKPDTKFNHQLLSKSNGLIWFGQADAPGGQKPALGTAVDFEVYADAVEGLGAESIRPRQAASQPAPKAAASRHANSHKAVIPTIGKTQLMKPTAKSGAKAPLVAPVGPSSAKQRAGAGAGPTPPAGPPRAGAGPRPPAGPPPGMSKGSVAQATSKSGRTRIATGKRQTGQVKAWCGKFGWIILDVPIDHPVANKRNGEIFLASDDLPPGQTVSAGTRIDCLLYADKNGLGAEQIRILPAGGAARPSQSGNASGASKLMTPRAKGSPAPKQPQTAPPAKLASQVYKPAVQVNKGQQWNKPATPANKGSTWKEKPAAPAKQPKVLLSHQQFW